MTRSLAPAFQRELLRLARQVIARGCTDSAPPCLDVERLPAELQVTGTGFVVLQKNGLIRGFAGLPESRRSLAEDVAHNAFASAFRDNRFPPVREEELAAIRITIAVLLSATPWPVHSQAELLAALQAGEQNFFLQSGGHYDLFLPNLTPSQPGAAQAFLDQFERLAGPEAMAIQCLGCRCETLCEQPLQGSPGTPC